MSDNSAIEWTNATWNPVTGCSKVSPGCKNCYAERMARRLTAMGQWNYRNGFKLTGQPQALEIPLMWKKPKTVFVNSMSDLFHPDIPFDFLLEIFNVMNKAYWHQFQVLTKRAEYMWQVKDRLEWPRNIWIGVSVENEDYKWRIDYLRDIPAEVRFLSLEPLLGPLPKLDLTGIDWVIVGGESGPRSRPMDPEWVIDIQNQCTEADVPFFFKQWGGFNKKANGRMLQGKTWDEVPAKAAQFACV